MKRDTTPAWPILTVAECACSEPYSTQIGPFGKALTPDAYIPSGVPLLRGVNVNNGRFHDDDYVFISEADADRLSKFESFPGDVLLVHKGSLGQIGLMPERRRFSRYIMGNSMLRVRCDRTKLLPEYLRYWLQSPDGQWYLLGRVSQVGVPQIQRPLTTLRKAALPVPPLEVQSNVVEVLGSLEDKIEQNRRTGKKLEELARAVFKAWFVDFAPVKAKAAGAKSFPGMPPATFAALPTRLVDSPLGPVPEGWEIGTLGDLLGERGERVSPSEETRRLPYVPIDCITTKRITLETFKSGEEAQSSLIRFHRGDVLFGAMRPYFHKVCLAPFSGTTRTTCFVLMPRTDQDRAFALLLASEDATIEYANTHSVGSTIPYAKWQNSLCDLPCVLPPEPIRAAFGLIAEPLMSLSNQGVLESTKLATLRDYLLPRLLSGKVRVCEMERTIGRVL